MYSLPVRYELLLPKKTIYHINCIPNMWVHRSGKTERIHVYAMTCLVPIVSTSNKHDIPYDWYIWIQTLLERF